MWLFIIAIIVTIISWFLFWLGSKMDCEPLACPNCVISIAMTILIVIFSVILVVKNISAEADFNELQAQHDILEYQLKNDYYTNLLEVNRYDFMTDVRKYNQEVVRGRILHNNPWLGGFYPIRYDELELVELNEEN